MDNHSDLNVTRCALGELCVAKPPLNALLTFYLVSLITMMIVGNFGNPMVICAVMLRNKLFSSGDIFILNLAIADSLVTLVIDVFNIISIVHGHTYFLNRHPLCEIVGAICMISCTCSLWSIMGISINRFVFICHNAAYKRLFSKINSLIMVAALWVACALVDLPNFVGWGGHAFDMKSMVCSYDRTANYGYTLFFILLVVGCPVLVVGACYIQVFLFVRRQKRRILNVSSTTSNFVHTVKKKEIQLIKTLFTIFVVFSLCWTPYSVLVLIDFEDRLPASIHIVTTIMAHASSSLNSILYGATNRQFREAYAKTIRRIACWGKTQASSDDPPASQTLPTASGSCQQQNSAVTYLGQAQKPSEVI